MPVRERAPNMPDVSIRLVEVIGIELSLIEGAQAACTEVVVLAPARHRHEESVPLGIGIQTPPFPLGTDRAP